MHVLVAAPEASLADTTHTSRALEGELVRLPVSVGDDGTDEGAFIGLASSRPTARARVVELDDLDAPTLTGLIVDGFTRDQVTGKCSSAASLADEQLLDLAAITEWFGSGTVLEMSDFEIRALSTVSHPAVRHAAKLRQW